MGPCRPCLQNSPPEGRSVTFIWMRVVPVQHPKKPEPVRVGVCIERGRQRYVEEVALPASPTRDHVSRRISRRGCARVRAHGHLVLIDVENLMGEFLQPPPRPSVAPLLYVDLA